MPYGSHDYGQNVLEFEVMASFYNSYGENPGTSGWKPEWGGKRAVAAFSFGASAL